MTKQKTKSKKSLKPKQEKEVKYHSTEFVRDGSPCGLGRSCQAPKALVIRTRYGLVIIT